MRSTLDQNNVATQIKAIVRYPKSAQVGERYLMTVDVSRENLSDEEWPYEQEEFPIHCLLDSMPLFSYEMVGEPAVVLHRYGGTYGPATFLLTARQPGPGVITVSLINSWGTPIKLLDFDCEIQPPVESEPFPNAGIFVPLIDSIKQQWPQLAHSSELDAVLALLKERRYDKASSKLAEIRAPEGDSSDLKLLHAITVIRGMIDRLRGPKRSDTPDAGKLSDLQQENLDLLVQRAGANPELADLVVEFGIALVEGADKQALDVLERTQQHSDTAADDLEEALKRARQTYETLRGEQPDWSGPVRAAREQLHQLERQKSALEAVQSWLRAIRAPAEAGDYRKVLELAAEDLLSDIDDLPAINDMRQAIAQLRSLLTEALDAATAHADQLSRAGHSKHAQQIMQNVVQPHYHSYPPAVALERGWRYREIEQRFEEDQRSYDDLLQRVDRLRGMFWDDASEQAALAQPHDLDLDALLDAPALEDAQRLIDGLADDDDQRAALASRLDERRALRWMLRLKGLIYGGGIERFRPEYDAAAIDAPQLRDEHQAAEAILLAQRHLDAGRWNDARETAQQARSLYSDAPRIRALMSQLQGDRTAAEQLGEKLSENWRKLSAIEEDSDRALQLLVEVHLRLREIAPFVQQSNYTRDTYAGEVTEQEHQFKEKWKELARRMLDSWQRNFKLEERSEQFIEQNANLLDIVPEPVDATLISLSTDLRAREHLSRATLALRQAALRDAAAEIERAERLLPDTDEGLRYLSWRLGVQKQHAGYEQGMARAELGRKMLSKAREHINAWLRYNAQDQDAAQLKSEIDERIAEVQAQARAAHTLEQIDLGAAVKRWDQVQAQHLDGSYPDGAAEARSLNEWFDDASRRYQNGSEQVTRVYEQFQDVCEELAKEPIPDWNRFARQRAAVRQAISNVEPGMGYMLGRCRDALDRLDAYSAAYQRLEDLLLLEGAQVRERRAEVDKAKADLDAAWAAVGRFEGRELIPDLSSAVRASYDRICSLIDL